MKSKIALVFVFAVILTAQGIGWSQNIGRVANSHWTSGQLVAPVKISINNRVPGVVGHSNPSLTASFNQGRLVPAVIEAPQIQAVEAPRIENNNVPGALVKSIGDVVSRINEPSKQEKNDKSMAEISGFYDGTKGRVKTVGDAVYSRRAGRFVPSLLNGKGSSFNKSAARQVPPVPKTDAAKTSSWGKKVLATAIMAGMPAISFAADSAALPPGMMAVYGAFFGLAGAMAGVLSSIGIAGFIDTAMKGGIGDKSFNRILIAGSVIGAVAAVIGGALGPAIFNGVMFSLFALMYLSLMGVLVIKLIRRIRRKP